MAEVNLLLLLLPPPLLPDTPATAAALAARRVSSVFSLRARLTSSESLSLLSPPTEEATGVPLKVVGESAPSSSPPWGVEALLRAPALAREEGAEPPRPPRCPGTMRDLVTMPPGAKVLGARWGRSRWGA